MNAYLTGLLLSLSLILVIGAQNAFVLRQGLKRQCLLTVCFICALSDGLLIVIGVFSFHQIAAQYHWLIDLSRYAGAAFLIAYGVQNLYSAWQSSKQLTAKKSKTQSSRQIILTCLALTWLNPHVYLDTVFLIGSVSSQFEAQKIAFALGAVSASFLFFFTLGYGARLLSPWFQKKRAWQILDIITAMIMFAIAWQLIA